MLSIAVRVGYGSPHTLTATSVKVKPGACQGDAAVLAPSLLVFAPAVLDKIYAGLNAKIAAAGGLKKKLFDLGIASGMGNAKRGGWFVQHHNGAIGTNGTGNRDSLTLPPRQSTNLSAHRLQSTYLQAVNRLLRPYFHFKIIQRAQYTRQK